ncbi:MAG: adenosylhomocysteinase [Solirubrobacteraceae bacterium]|jgi:adenosylhomocysteinase|nr:adenosylhomocysteinase [Solirubrobacteraceae bacterium]
MPVLRSIRERFASERPLAGIRIGACLHVTAETAVLVRTLEAAGASVALCSANPLSTQDDVVAALGPVAFAQAGEAAPQLEPVLATEPQVTLDDGADLAVAMLDAEGLIGGTEETTSGLVGLRAIERSGRLKFPILAVNEAASERAFNDRFGTGQSALDGILRATNLLLAGQSLVVLGYGTTGRGIALRARGAGATVIVCEVDPMRALEARMEGFDVLPALDAAERGDVFVTVTGNRDVLRREHFERMKDGAILANAGHFDVEISLPDLGDACRKVLPLVDEYIVGERRLNLLARGRVVNLAAGEGHPAAVMDVSFAIHALSVEELVRRAGELPPGVHPVPEAIDREVARLKLASLGVEIDSLTDVQQDYLTSWQRP